MSEPRMSDLFEHAPLHAKIRAKTRAMDEANAERNDAAGAAARFRLQHGFLAEYVVSEMARRTECGDLVEGLIDNLANAIVNFAMNLPRSEEMAIRFMYQLAEETMGRLQGAQGEPDFNRQGYLLADPETGKLVDYDVIKDLQGTRR